MTVSPTNKWIASALAVVALLILIGWASERDMQRFQAELKAEREQYCVETYGNIIDDYTGRFLSSFHSFRDHPEIFESVEQE